MATAEFSEKLRYDRRWVVAQVRRFSVIDNRVNALVLFAQWLLIALAMIVAITASHWFVYFAMGMFVGSRLQCLAVLMHDACHGKLFSNRRLNEIVGDLFVAYPLGISIDLYRASHLRHHRHLNTDDDYDFVFQLSDPDQRFPKSPANMVWLLAKSILGLNVLRMLRFARVWVPLMNLQNPPHLDIDFKLKLRARYLAWIVIVFGSIAASPWPWEILGLYLIPLFLWSNVFNRMRAMAEHNGVANTTELNATRTVIPSLCDRFFIVPLNVSYHLEHHLFPTVTWLNLRRLHELLCTDSSYKTQAHVTRGYWRVIQELGAAHTS